MKSFGCGNNCFFFKSPAVLCWGFKNPDAFLKVIVYSEFLTNSVPFEINSHLQRDKELFVFGWISLEKKNSLSSLCVFIIYP